MTDLDLSADTSPTSLIPSASLSSRPSLGSATEILPPPEINALLWALDTLGWDTEAVPLRACGDRAGAPPAMAASRSVSPLAPPHAKGSAPLSCGCVSSLSHWWIAARPRTAMSPVADTAGAWEVCYAWEWDQRLRACELRQVS